MSLEAILHSSRIDFSADVVGKLEKYSEILLEWNKIHNLSGAKNTKDVYLNILDSLLPTKEIPFASTILDVGTGAGFPGLILAIALPHSYFTLCEPLKKRATFLRFVVTMLELPNVEVVAQKVQELQKRDFGLITSRAVTDTKFLLTLTKNIRTPQTQYLLYKGSRVFEEIEDISDYELTFDILQKDKRNYLYIKSIIDVV